MQQRDRRVRTGAVLLLCTIFLSGCVGINPKARMELQGPPDCAESAEQIQTLEEARAGGVFRFTQFLQALAPPMVALSLLRDIYGKPYRSSYLDHWRVWTGSYNRKIDARVNELHSCAQ